MYDLPPEMLFAIFKACIGAEDHRQPLVLSHVCSQWRSIALANPSLWTQLRIHGTWQDLHAYLERSRPMSVDLTIVCTSQARWVIADFVHEQLSRPEYQHDLRRIRSMDLVASPRCGSKCMPASRLLTGDTNTPIPLSFQHTHQSFHQVRITLVPGAVRLQGDGNNHTSLACIGEVGPGRAGLSLA
ncbi:hypothetical protein FA13DRAFT_1739050 [Coprinellus micaceus]|uniref:F-box domain-containing protein n=1 Tax=Coprinellus micaceus TaxID=71717 RepID=A0A4Y7SS67_COPMI|nr:hypothetical protein FA13DRAFT_1739050 [Coprinellus micaceus]